MELNQTKYGVVYLILNKVNNKKYIGITTNKRGFNGRYPSRGKGIERVYNYLKCLEDKGYPINTHLLKSIEKYTIDNFEVDEELDIAYSEEELLNKEKYWINYYQSNKYNTGYNYTDGGEKLKHGNQNLLSKIKRRITRAKEINRLLEYWYKERSKWENKHLYIWDTNDGLTMKQKHLLWHKLGGGKTKFCKLCGVEYYHSGKGDYCEFCGEETFFTEYKEIKNKIKKVIIKQKMSEL